MSARANPAVRASAARAETGPISIGDNFPPVPRDEEKLRKVLANLPAGAYTCDGDGLITYFNERAAELWGREPKLHNDADRFCGSFRLSALDGTPIPHDRCWMALALKEGREYNGCEILVERPDGTTWVALAHANPFFDDEGAVVGAVNVLVDISDRKRAEEALREADRRKDEFMAVLAHELRNPLAPIRTGLEVLKMAEDNPALREEVRGTMERQTDHLVALIDDLLDISRITCGKLRLRKSRTQLSTVIQDALVATRPLFDDAGHSLTVELPDEDIPLHADPNRLTQVFSNLLSNAAKYTPDGGDIQLRAQRENDGSTVFVSVQDNGVGISTEDHGQIFEMFSQIENPQERVSRGLGIGLTLARSLVHMHDGEISVHSDGPAKGSTFSVRLPILAGPAEEGDSSADDSGSPDHETH